VSEPRLDEGAEGPGSADTGQLGKMKADLDRAAAEGRSILNSTVEEEQGTLQHDVLFGPDGLRPGWGLLLFAVLYFALLQGLFFAAELLRLVPLDGMSGREQRPQRMLVIEALMAMSTMGATWLMARIEPRPMASYGFGGERRARLFATGFLWGLGFLGLLVWALWGVGCLAFDGRLLFGVDVLRYGAIWLVGFVLVAVFEESLMRGYLQSTLTRGVEHLYEMAFKAAPQKQAKVVGFWTAAVALSFLFGAGHGSNPGESPIGLLSAGLIGLVFCLTLWRTGSLWWALGFHAAWDWAQSFIFGVADSGAMAQFHLLGTHPVGNVLLSGGVTGPEGSVLILGVLALVAVVTVWTLPNQPPAETSAK